VLRGGEGALDFCDGDRGAAGDRLRQLRGFVRELGG